MRATSAPAARAASLRCPAAREDNRRGCALLRTPARRSASAGGDTASGLSDAAPALLGDPRLRAARHELIQPERLDGAERAGTLQASVRRLPGGPGQHAAGERVAVDALQVDLAQHASRGVI